MQTDHLTIEQISAFLDDALEPRERGVAEAHFEDCAECQRELAELRQTASLLRVVPNHTAPRSFRVAAQTAPVVADRPEEPRGRLTFMNPLWLRALSGVAAVFMVVAFASDFLAASAPRTMQAPISYDLAAPAAEGPAAAQAPSAPGAAERRAQPAAPVLPPNVTGSGPGASAPAGAPAIGGAGSAAEGGQARPSDPVALQRQAESPMPQGATEPRIEEPSSSLSRQAPARATTQSNVNAASRSGEDAAMRSDGEPSRPTTSPLTPGRVGGVLLAVLAAALLAASFVSSRRERKL